MVITNKKQTTHNWVRMSFVTQWGFLHSYSVQKVFINLIIGSVLCIILYNVTELQNRWEICVHIVGHVAAHKRTSSLSEHKEIKLHTDRQEPQPTRTKREEVRV